MQIIRQLEKGPRGVYCGALGIIFPRKRAVFNLPIRTITLNGNRGQMGVGSGIVIDSDPENEFNECVLKARFLTEAKKDFQLRETILWDNGYRFLAGHLKRLKNSAQYFSFEYKEPVVRKQLNALARKFKKACAYRVRMLMDRHGVISFESAPINQKMHPQTLRIAISKHKVDADNVHLYHKTTRRQPYDSEHAHYYSKGFFDVVFKNTKNEFTEGAISNIIIEKEKQLFTPPVSSGLLPGVYRSYLIQRCKVKEKKLFLKDLREADKVFLCNSVRGMVEVRLES
jgi:para-aminobenzoate synthetase/4-amino-4-deoxychorismate lyase